MILVSIQYGVRSDYNQRFRDSYSTTRPEYNDHAFKANIDGKTREIRVLKKKNVNPSIPKERTIGKRSTLWVTVQGGFRVDRDFWKFS